MALLCKNNQDGGSARALPVAAPMPKSAYFLRKMRDSSGGGGGGGGGRICLVWRCVSELAYLSMMVRPCIYSGCSTS